MPIIEFRCKTCNRKHESIFLNRKDIPESELCSCGNTAIRVPSIPVAHFKGIEHIPDRDNIWEGSGLDEVDMVEGLEHQVPYERKREYLC